MHYGCKDWEGIPLEHVHDPSLRLNEFFFQITQQPTHTFHSESQCRGGGVVGGGQSDTLFPINRRNGIRVREGQEQMTQNGRVGLG